MHASPFPAHFVADSGATDFSSEVVATEKIEARHENSYDIARAVDHSPESSKNKLAMNKNV